MSPAAPEDPGDVPPSDPAGRRKWMRDRERFLMEGGKPLPDRGAENLPDSTDVRLKQLALSHDRFLSAHKPFTDAVALALMRPTNEVLHSAEQVRRFAAAQAGDDVGSYVIPTRPSIVSITEALVAKAILGDTAAITQIAERVEGKAGLRQGDDGEEAPEQRKQAAMISERLIRAMVGDRLSQKTPGDDAKAVVVDVTPEPLDSSKDK
jgi:hypothetical protein